MKNMLKSMLSGNKISIAKISSGTLLGQVISFVTLPIITRIYGAEIIGIWTLLNSAAMIIMSFSDLGMTNAIMLEKKEDIEDTYKVITSIVAIISVVASFVMTVYYTVFNDVMGINPAALFLIVVAIIFTTQQIQVCYTWLNRNADYNVLMKNPIIRNGFYSVIAIILGLLGMNKSGYFIGQIAGLLITLIHMKRHLPKSFFTLNSSIYKETFVRNHRFIKYQMPTKIISSFKSQVPTLLIQGIWGTEMLGYYGITVRLLQMPSALLADAVGRVFFQTTSKMKREGKEIGYYVYNNLIKGMKIAFIPIVFLMAFGDIILVAFLGVEWKMAGDFVRILTLQYFFTFLMMTVQGLSITLEKQNYAMISCGMQIIGYVLGAVIGKYIFDSLNYALIFMSGFFITINITFFSALFKVMRIPRKPYIIKALLSMFGIVGLSFVFRYIFELLS
ncbi:MAG: colanic acid exporter [Firmicutes bacterium ADurb.Bin419]|nr:MAG: colanic acid exporter [Firmicutes bacterium ADurb.Bin419]